MVRSGLHGLQPEMSGRTAHAGMTTSKRIRTFCDEARRLGALDAVIVSPQKVFTATWVRLRCQYGCSEYGQCLTCPPHSPLGKN